MSLIADACPSSLGPDQASVPDVMDAGLIQMVLSNVDDVVSSVEMEGEGIVVPNLIENDVNAIAVGVDDLLEVASPEVGVDLCRVEAAALSESSLPLDAERSPWDVPQQSNEAVAVDTDVHIDIRTCDSRAGQWSLSQA